ncbi:transposon Ty3-I Gag-Pol polyprotein [Trichonephila clavipes]|nr:transposon Ty3-I Gag-Pol polyprotein [Trichonephila clavipes]
MSASNSFIIPTLLAHADNQEGHPSHAPLQTERECIAFVWAVAKFRPYIFGRHFKIVTDHHSLCWLTALKDPSGRLARCLQEYDQEIVYKSGKKHKDANSLSRNHVEDEVFPSEQKTTLASFSNIAEEQRKDPELPKLIHIDEKAELVTKSLIS